MRLVWATDVHLDFVDRAQAREVFCAAVASHQPDMLLLGGDIAESPSVSAWLQLLADALAPLPIAFVLGNHDYYDGSIADTRAQVAALADRVPSLHWLPQCGPLSLGGQAALGGHSGWGDGRLGDFLTTPIRINDHVRIAELSELPRAELLGRLRALGDEAAQSLDRQLQAAIQAGAQTILVLTHVPPYQSACWHGGRTPPSDSPWLPDFTCGATGELLDRCARAHPDIQLEVLCGHTHGAGETTIRDNLRVRTGGADYGSPGVAGVLEL